MFLVSCDTCATTNLFGVRRLLGMENTEHGIVVRVRCFCGAEAVTVTGRDGRASAAGDVDGRRAHRAPCHAHAA